jgi:hypothetical protein
MGAPATWKPDSVRLVVDGKEVATLDGPVSFEAPPAKRREPPASVPDDVAILVRRWKLRWW